MKQRHRSIVWLRRHLALTVVLFGMIAGAAPENKGKEPLILAEQGSFAVGGTVITGENGDTFHGDHAVVRYQIPIGAKDLPLVMWHGGGQFTKTWETTPDGRDGYQQIFTRRGWGVYLLDQPRRGDAGRTTVGTTIPDAVPNESFLFSVFRLGTWNPPEPPEFFPNVQFSRDPEALNQYWRQITPDTGPLEQTPESMAVRVDAVSALFDKIGPGVLLTHSLSGHYGWLTRIKNDNVKAIVAYEPVVFTFPENDPPAPVPTEVESVASLTEPILVSEEEFAKLTEIPIQIVYGDNIEFDTPSPNAGVEEWRVVAQRVQQFADAVNARGGDVEVLYLPDVGLTGNTHFPFSDLNNVKVAALLSEWLEEKGLDK